MEGRTLKRWGDEITLAAGAMAVLAGSWLAGRAANPGAIGFRLDDAWIHLVYGRGLWHDGFPAYNPGQPATGCTSWAWAACLAAMHALFGRASLGVLIGAVIALGGLLHVGLVVSVARLARALTASRVAALVAGGATALATPLALASFSGMEVTLTAWLLVSAVHAAVSRRWTRAGLLLAMSVLARPESFVVVAVITVAALARVERADGPRVRLALRLLAPTLAVAIVVVAYDLWASGKPFPATFYAKSSGGFATLPARAWTALTSLFPQVPPFAGGVAWLALFGLADRRGEKNALRLVPLAAAVAFTLANLWVVDPVDPPAFYHLRYVLPTVPLFLVALVQGAHLAGRRLRGRATLAPILALAALSLLGAARTLVSESRHYHNDVRNINEVQRRIGTWLAQRTPDDAWIASSDAGAIRYCSNRPTVDVIGLNTPEMLEHDEEYVRAHPVAAVALLPAWFRPRDPDALAVVLRVETDDYTVTSNRKMGRQIVLVPASTEPGGRVRARFSGFHAFELDVLAGDVVAQPPTDAP